MATCPFAKWDEISGPVNTYTGGPFKIVHHTTEGTTYLGARATFKENKSDPHFTVEGADIYQHIDTAKSARALRNDPGGVQTNRESAVQIEVVGFASKAKDPMTLATVAKLCRWIEQEHGVPQVWPSGRPRSSTSGHDPGGHNRNAANWDNLGGHYGHSQVPENSHWDPGYTADEVAVVTPNAAPDAVPFAVAADPPPSGSPAGAHRRHEAPTRVPRPISIPVGEASIRVAVVFDPHDHVAVRVQEAAGRRRGAEVSFDSRNGTALWHAFAPWRGSRGHVTRTLVVEATVNGEPARVGRAGGKLYVFPGPAPLSRRGRKATLAEITLFTKGGRPRPQRGRGGCPPTG